MLRDCTWISSLNNNNTRLIIEYLRKSKVLKFLVEDGVVELKNQIF